jgi:hypothetical protein
VKQIEKKQVREIENMPFSVTIGNDSKSSLERLMLGSHRSRLDLERLIKDSKSIYLEKTETKVKPIVYVKPPSIVKKAEKPEAKTSPINPSEECPEVDIGGPVNQPTLFGSSIKAQNQWQRDEKEKFIKLLT